MVTWHNDFDLRLGVSTGRVGSVLDPTRTRPVGVGWKAEGPETDRRRHSVESVLGSGRFGRCWESPDPANVAGIFKKFSGICKNPVDLHQKLPKSAWISSNLAGSHQIWSRSRLDLLECRRISPNLAWISSNVAGSHQISLECRRILPDFAWMSSDIARFEYNVGRVGWLGFWGRKPATQPTGIKSWGQKPVTDRRSGRVGRLPVWVRAGCSGWSGSGLGWTPLDESHMNYEFSLLDFVDLLN